VHPWHVLNLVQTFVGNQVPLTVVNLVEVVLMMIAILSCSIRWWRDDLLSVNGVGDTMAVRTKVYPAAQ
jgi:hypothetical protein